MDYDTIFDEIGHFGRWQQLNFFIGSLCLIGSSFICFMFTFIGFVPKFRCFVPECDGNVAEAEYLANFTDFTIPNDQDDDATDGPHQCAQYMFRNISRKYLSLAEKMLASDTCSEEYFDLNVTKICHQHVYDSSQYKYTLTAELDLSPCESSSDYWNLEASINKKYPENIKFNQH